MRVPQPPDQSSNAGYAEGAVNRGRLLFGYFLLAKQEKVTSSRSTTGEVDLVLLRWVSLRSTHPTKAQETHCWVTQKTLTQPTKITYLPRYARPNLFRRFLCVQLRTQEIGDFFNDELTVVIGVDGVEVVMQLGDGFAFRQG